MGGTKKGGGLGGSNVVTITLERSSAQQLATALALALGGGVSATGAEKGKSKGAQGGMASRGAKGSKGGAPVGGKSGGGKSGGVKSGGGGGSKKGGRR
jgi:hypothetical protein